MGRHSHTLARTHSQHSLTLIHSHAHTRKWHAFISLHDNCERTDAGTDGQIPRASRFLWPAESPLLPSPARFPSRSLPDLHFNWFLSSSALKSLANVFAEHVFYANISGNATGGGGYTRGYPAYPERTRTAVAPDTLQIFIEHDF